MSICLCLQNTGIQDHRHAYKIIIIISIHHHPHQIKYTIQQPPTPNNNQNENQVRMQMFTLWNHQKWLMIWIEIHFFLFSSSPIFFIQHYLLSSWSYWPCHWFKVICLNKYEILLFSNFLENIFFGFPL